jgi:hypothetical protein
MSQARPEENLSRYLFNKNHFSSKNGRVKYNAFLPNQNGKTSVFRTSELSNDEIWRIGDDVADEREMTLLGRGEICARHVVEQGLELDANDDPPRHADIIGWPEEKSAQKLIAIELESNAELYLKG